MILESWRVTTDEVPNHSWFHLWNHPLHSGVSLCKIFFPGNSQNSTSTHAWISANTFESLSHWRWHLFKMHCHWVQNMCPTQQSREHMPEEVPIVEHYEERADLEIVWDVGRHTEPSSLRHVEDKCQIVNYYCLMVPAHTRCHLNHPNYWNLPGSALWSVGTSCVWPDLAPLCCHFSLLRHPYEAISFAKTDMWRNLCLHELLLSQRHYIFMCTEICLLLDYVLGKAGKLISKSDALPHF